jgi:hypothetical protein
MGGFGSGRWKWHTKRATAEESKRLYVKDYRESLARIDQGRTAAVYHSPSWTRGGQPSGNISLIFAGGPSAINSRLQYTLTNWRGEKTAYNYPVEIAYTLTPWGARRYWWICPGCGRRCGTLYLPPSSGRFACRACHDLTYQKCQESHQHDAFYRQLAGQVPGTTPAYLKALWEDHSLEDLLAGKRDGKKLTRKQKIKLYNRLVPAEERAARMKSILEEIQERESARYSGYLSAGDLCERAGLAPSELESLHAARLLVPDHEGLYRPKLAGWAGKLATLLHAGWTINELRRWAVGRWSTPNPRAWPPDRAEWQADS